MRVLVAGGTGRLGSRLANRLARQGHQVRVLSRGLTPRACELDDGIEVVRGDVRDARTLTEPMRDVEVVVSAVQGFQGPGGVSPASVDRDGNLHLIEAAEGVGASFVLLSVIGAAADSRVELFRMKYAAEQRLRASRCRWTIVRADAYAETWRDLMEQTAGSSHRPLVFGDGDTPVSFVSIDDVLPLVEQRRPRPRPGGSGPRDLRTRGGVHVAAGWHGHGEARVGRQGAADPAARAAPRGEHGRVGATVDPTPGQGGARHGRAADQDRRRAAPRVSRTRPHPGVGSGGPSTTHSGAPKPSICGPCAFPAWVGGRRPSPQGTNMG